MQCDIFRALSFVGQRWALGVGLLVRGRQETAILARAQLMALVVGLILVHVLAIASAVLMGRLVGHLHPVGIVIKSNHWELLLKHLMLLDPHLQFELPLLLVMCLNHRLELR